MGSGGGGGASMGSGGGASMGSGGGGGASMGSGGGASMGGGGSSMGSGGGGGGGSSAGGSAAGAGGASMGGLGDKMGGNVQKVTNGLTKLGTGSGTTGSFRDANNTSPLGMAFNGSKASAFGNPIIGSQGGGGSSGQSRGKGGMTSGGRAGGSTRSGAGGMGGMGGSTPNGTMAGATSRTASYMTQPIFDSPVARERSATAGLVAPRVLNDVQGTFARSARFQGDSAITVLNQGSAIVLRGVVATDKERRVAESMVRMSPGVREVQNEIEVAGNPE